MAAKPRNTMASRAQVLIPIAIAAVIIGIVGMLSIPKDVKLEQAQFPKGIIKIDDVTLQVRSEEHTSELQSH